MIFIIAGCQARPLQLKPALEDEGEVFVYMKPFPANSGRLSFTADGIYALKDDGTETQLQMHLQEFKMQAVSRQRLIASGRLPEGVYTALLFRIRNAGMKTEEGEAALRVPEEPVKIDFQFTINKRKAGVLSLTFKYAESIISEFSFMPVFSVSIPGKPVIALTGYISNSGSNNVAVFNKSTREVVGMIATGIEPRGIALDQNSKRAYVALSGEDAVDVIDVTAGDVINRIRLNSGDRPGELSLTPDKRLLLTANTGSDTVSFIDPFSLIELSRVSVGDNPVSLLIDNAGRRAYVFNTYSDNVSVIDIANRVVISTIATESSPLRGQLNRKGDSLYIVHEFSPYLIAIDPFSFAILKRIFVGIGADYLKVDSRTDMLYLGRRGEPIMEIYDPFSFIAGDIINIGTGVSFITIDGEENNIYAIAKERNTVLVISISGKKIIGEIDAGESPYWVTMMGER